VSYNQGNTFSDNTYYGPWSFWAFSQGNTDSWSTWSAPLVACTQWETSSCPSGFGQDSGSTLATSGGPYWS
jgi:hypothetical protein